MKAIAVDAMGGDYAPVEIVRGALDAVRSWRIPVVLVGDETQILPLVKAAGMTLGWMNIRGWRTARRKMLRS